MKAFLLALQFLTGISIGSPKTFPRRQLQQTLYYYPIVGLLIGAFAAGISIVAGFFVTNMISKAIVIIVGTVILTRGLHLDGLADTVDAFFSNKTTEEMLRIMKDPHVGSLGIISIAASILLKIAFIGSFSEEHLIRNLLLIGCLSRYGMVVLMCFFDYARPLGKAEVFIAGATPAVFGITSIFTLIFASLIIPYLGLVLTALTIGVSLLIGRYSKRKINGITGDVIGASNEIIEIVVAGVLVAAKGYWGA